MVIICEFEGCDKVATYGIKGKVRFVRCQDHKQAGDKKCYYTPCEIYNCGNLAYYGGNDKKQIHCKDHRRPGEKDHSRGNKCKTCDKHAIYKESESGNWYCVEHKTDNSESKHFKKCKQEGCEKRAGFNYKGLSERIYCQDHKLDRMVCDKVCEYGDCLITPSFAKDGSKKGIRCEEHKLPDMVNVKMVKCIIDGCDKQATWVKFGTATCKYCNIHGPDYPEYVPKGKRCVIKNCHNPTRFGLKKATHCKEHKNDDMKDFNKNKCAENDCKKAGNYKDFDGKLHCKDHSVDKKLKSLKKCDIEGCTKYASRGPLFGKLTKCATHAPKNYLCNYLMRPKCQEGECKNKPVMGLPKTNKPLTCEDHKKEGYVNLIEKPCQSCGLLYIIPEGVELCYDCDRHTQRKFVKTKELTIKKLLDNKSIKYESHDKIIDVDCNKYRPDFVIDCNTFYLVVEVDEEQHKGYARPCEINRMKNIHQALGMDTIFIRFNPDTYTNNLKKVVKSYAGRELALINLINSIKNLEKLDYHLMVVYLFYNEYDGKPNIQKIEY